MSSHPPSPSSSSDYDVAELETLLQRHLPWLRDYVHRHLSSLLRSKAETGDIVQDALVRYLRYGPRFRLSDEARFRLLLARIIENVLRDRYDWFNARRRAISRERPLGSETVLDLDPPRGHELSPSGVVQHHEREAWVRLALELMDPEERRLIVMRDWEDLSFDEIGRRENLSKGQARRRYLQALDGLIDHVVALKSGDLDRWAAREGEGGP